MTLFHLSHFATAFCQDTELNPGAVGQVKVQWLHLGLVHGLRPPLSAYHSAQAPSTALSAITA